MLRFLALTAVLFAAVHNPTALFLNVPFIPVMVFPLALALGWAYHRTQRLAAPILLHLLHNAVSVAILLLDRTSK